ncbi:carotenoid biosynthesis protein [Jatrophihabitans sp. YIM 134969]
MTTAAPVVRGLHARRTGDVVPAVLYAATVLAQIVYPLTAEGGAGRDRLTFTVVILGAAAAVAHAVGTIGRRGFAGLAAVAGIGLAAEATGVATGFPFGSYAYAGTLGPEVAGVPWLVVAAWVSMAWPAAVAARLLARRFAARVALAAVGLAAWDVFLDPQMVTAGHWTWAPGGWRLPGIPDVPVGNFAGWLGVAVLIAVVLQAVPPPAEVRTAWLPAGYFVWTAASSALAAAAFWGRPAVAAWGLLAMGPVAAATARRLWRR